MFVCYDLKSRKRNIIKQFSFCNNLCLIDQPVIESCTMRAIEILS